MAEDVHADGKKTGRRRRQKPPAAEPEPPPLEAAPLVPEAAPLVPGDMVVAVTTLSSYPGNARQADMGKIAASIRDLGLYGGTIVVQLSTRRILAGHHVFAAAVEQGQTAVPVYVVDCDDATARRIVLADNRLAGKARNDRYSLESLLAEVEQLPGFSADDVAAMVADAVGHLPTPRARPDVEAEDEEGAAVVEDEAGPGAVARLKIECGTERRQRSLVEHLTARRIPCKAVIG